MLRASIFRVVPPLPSLTREMDSIEVTQSIRLYVQEPNMDECSWKPLVIVHAGSLEMLVLISAKESAAARGQINLETRGGGKQAKGKVSVQLECCQKVLPTR